MTHAARIAAQEQRSVATALIFDTNSSSRDSLCRLLAECQIRCIAVTDCVAARKVLRSEAVDILICEDLGGLLGVEVLEMCAALFPSIRRVIYRAPRVRINAAATDAHLRGPAALRR